MHWIFKLKGNTELSVARSCYVVHLSVFQNWCDLFSTLLYVQYIWMIIAFFEYTETWVETIIVSFMLEQVVLYQPPVG